MLPLFDTFKKELLEKEVDVLDLTSMQTSVLTKYFSELGTTKTWDVAIQSAIPINKNDPSEGFITLDRTFQDLVFHPDAYDFDYIKTDKDTVEFYSPTLNEQEKIDENPNYLSKYNYWLVVQCLTVKEWFSNSSKELQNFNCWEYKEHVFQQEIIFKHKLIHSYSWNRPTQPGDQTSLSNDSEGSTLVSCSIGSGEGSPTYNEDNVKLTTGHSKTFQNSSGECKKWSSLDLPFVLTVNARQALGASITINKSFLNPRVYLKDTETSEEKIEVPLGSFEDPIQLTKQYIEIVIDDPGKEDLQSIHIDFYGEEWYRVQVPFKHDEETDYIMHDEQTLANTDIVVEAKEGQDERELRKLHPPRSQKLGINGEITYTSPIFKTNFRLNKEFTPISNFANRMSSNF